MTSLDAGLGRLRTAAGQLVAAANALASAGATVVRPLAGPITHPWDRFGRWLKSVMPKGLYARSLLIIIVPMVVLQSVVRFHVPGAALEFGDELSVVGGDAGNRHADRCL